MPCACLARALLTPCWCFVRTLLVPLSNVASALLVAASTLGGAVSWTVVAGALVIVASLFLVRLALQESKKPQLFAVDRREPLRPLQTDQDARNKVLRRNFNPDLIPADLDAVVVGSGMGGMTAAALMALAGKKVLVLEQHDRAGGCTHAFVEKGYEFDVGIHYVGEMGVTRKKTKNGVTTAATRRLLDQLTCGQLQWAPLEEQFGILVVNLSLLNCFSFCLSFLYFLLSLSFFLFSSSYPLFLLSSVFFSFLLSFFLSFLLYLFLFIFCVGLFVCYSLFNSFFLFCFFSFVSFCFSLFVSFFFLFLCIGFFSEFFLDFFLCFFRFLSFCFILYFFFTYSIFPPSCSIRS